ncbi:MAG: MFS transporter, partial [Dehalococcoidia bacterium]|nr:MFS transporter [Dehalococcoidia bacterium]
MAQYWRRLRHAYYGWWMLAASVVAVALAAGISFWSFGLYVDPLESQFGWSRAEVSGGFSVGFLASAIAAPLIGWWIDRYGPRRVILIGAVLTAASYVLLATTSDLWQWFVYQSINAVFRQMMFFIPFQTLISRWFDRRRGLAV